MNLYHPIAIGAVNLPGNLFLAPVAGYTERSFRSLCVEQGADFSFTELVSAEALVRAEEAGRALPCATEILLRRAANETRYAIQLFGSSPEAMSRAALIVQKYAPSVLDINSGCPVPKVTKTGAGSALMKSPRLLGGIVCAIKKAVPDIPVTVKIRSGWDAASINYDECADAAVSSGAALVSLHPRTKTQGYEGKSNWAHIAALAASLPVPVCGSGDLFSPQDAKRMLEETGCAAVMFARGATGNPFIFSETRALLQRGAHTSASHDGRIQMALRHLELLAEDIGEKSACLEMRKTFCAYIKGIPGAAALRNRLVRSSTIAEYSALLEAGAMSNEQ